MKLVNILKNDLLSKKKKEKEMYEYQIINRNFWIVFEFISNPKQIYLQMENE